MNSALKYISLLLIAGTLAFVACEKDKECSQSTVAGVNFKLSKFSDSKIQHFYITPLNNINDTLYATSGDYIKTLPLSASIDSTTFAFIANDSTLDKIVFFHSLKLTFIDEACGFVPKFKIDSLKYSNLGLDSIAWVFDEVTTDIENENIKLFY